MNPAILRPLGFLLLTTLSLQAASPKLGANAARVQAALPSGTTLAKANCEEIATAIGVAAAADPGKASSLLPEVIAYMRAVNPSGDGEISKNGPEDPEARRFYPTEQCLRNFLQSAIQAAPDQSAEIVEQLLASNPEYGPAVNQFLNNGGAIGDGGGLFGPGGGGIGPGFGPSLGSVPGSGGGFANPDGGGPGPDDDDDDAVTPDRPR